MKQKKIEFEVCPRCQGEGKTVQLGLEDECGEYGRIETCYWCGGKGKVKMNGS